MCLITEALLWFEDMVIMILCGQVSLKQQEQKEQDACVHRQACIVPHLNIPWDRTIACETSASAEI